MSTNTTLSRAIAIAAVVKCGDKLERASAVCLIAACRILRSYGGTLDMMNAALFAAWTALEVESDIAKLEQSEQGAIDPNAPGSKGEPS